MKGNGGARVAAFLTGFSEFTVKTLASRRHEEHEVGNSNFPNLRMLRTTMFENPRNLGKSCRLAIADPPPQGVCYTPLHSEYLSDCVLRPLRLNQPTANL